MFSVFCVLIYENILGIHKSRSTILYTFVRILSMVIYSLLFHLKVFLGDHRDIDWSKCFIDQLSFSNAMSNNICFQLSAWKVDLQPAEFPRVLEMALFTQMEMVRGFSSPCSCATELAEFLLLSVGSNQGWDPNKTFFSLLEEKGTNFFLTHVLRLNYQNEKAGFLNKARDL